MRGVTFVVTLALMVSGAAGVACTNSTDDFGLEGSSSGGKGSSRKRTANAATGNIGGDPETPSEETLNGANTDDDPSNDSQGDGGPPSGDASAPPPNPDPGPDPDPGPAVDPIPPGSYAVGTVLVTTANLNIRDGADTSYPIITTAPKDSLVQVVTVSGASGWVNISWNGKVGWSSKAYLAVP